MRSSWPLSKQGNLMCAEPWAARVHKNCVSCKSLVPAEEGSCGAFFWCYSLGHVTSLPLYGSNSTEPCGFKGKEMDKLCGWCGLVRIFFLFLLRKQLAESSSALYENGRAPFSPLPAGMSMSIFCGAALYHRQNQCHEISFPDLAHSCLWLLLHVEGNGADPLPWSLGCLVSIFPELQKCWALSWQPSHVPGPMCSDSRALSCSL